MSLVRRPLFVLLAVVALVLFASVAFAQSEGEGDTGTGTPPPPTDGLVFIPPVVDNSGAGTTSLLDQLTLRLSTRASAMWGDAPLARERLVPAEAGAERASHVARDRPRAPGPRGGALKLTRRRGGPALTAAVLGLHRCARSSLLALGGSATQRERVAREFHANSIVRGRPLVVVDCAQQEDRLGRWLRSWLGLSPEPAVAADADQGTLYLEGLTRLSPPMQQLVLMLVRRIAAETPEDAHAPGPYRVAGGDGEELLDAVTRGSFHAGLFDALDKVRVELGSWTRRGAA